jgi:tetratricopeptide (TPR) repeat protein
MLLRNACLSALTLAVLFAPLPAMADPAPPAPPEMTQPGSELTFWNAIKDSEKAEDYRAYLDRYPDGAFADLAKLRMKKYAAAPASAPAPAPAPAATDPLLAEIAYWNSIKDGKSIDAYNAYLKKYPNGEFADLARLRIAQLSPPAAAPVAQPAVVPIEPTPPAPTGTQSAAPKSASPKPSAPDPAAAPRMTFEAEDMTVYAKNGGQVRAAPSPQAPLIVKLETDADVHATGLSSDHRWWRVEVADGRIGYMHHSVVDDDPAAEPEPVTPLPATTEPAPRLPATTPPATPLPATTAPATSLPATTIPATSLPATTAPATPRPAATVPASPTSMLPPSDDSIADLETAAAPGGQETAAGDAAPDEGVCPATSQVALDNRVAACTRLLAKAGSDAAKRIALGNLATALVQAQRYDEAVSTYKQAAALSPRDAAIYYAIGLARLDQQRFPEARAAFDKAAQLQPRNPEIVFGRGLSYIGLGDLETARLELKNALLMKDDAVYYEKLGEVEIARGDLDAAKLALERGRKADAGRSSLTLAVINYYLGDSAAAAAEVAANGSDPTAPLWNAIIRKAAGDADGAARALRAGRPAEGETWPGPIFAVLSGTMSLAQARAAAAATAGKVEPWQLCSLNFFGGEWAYVSGDKDGARTALQAALATRAFYRLEYAAAKARIARLDE